MAFARRMFVIFLCFVVFINTQNCSLNYVTGNITTPEKYGSWNRPLLIVSPIVVTQQSTFVNISFYTGINTMYTGSSAVDVVIYSDSNGFPAQLLLRVPNVDMSRFNISQYNCIPISPLQISPQTLWVGFWDGASTTNYPRYGIVKQRSNATTYYVLVSAPLPSRFPSNPSRDGGYVLLMGLTVQNVCPTLSCGSCVASPSCVWCLTSETCISRSNIPTCPSFTKDRNRCPVCSQYPFCQSCASTNGTCAWCETSGKPAQCILSQNDGSCDTAITNPSFC